MRIQRRVETAAAMEALGASIASALEAGDAVLLKGPLGAGKSTLARGLIRALAGADVEVPSPTFTLAQYYETPRLTVAHFDLYRLKSPREAFELGVDEALVSGAAVIEWPERLEGTTYPDRLDIEIAFDADEARLTRLEAFGRLTGRMPL